MPTTEPEGRWDPLGQGVRLPHAGAFFPLGFRLEASSNDQRALDLLERAFPFREHLFDAPTLSLRIVANDGDPCASPPVYRASGRLLSLAGEPNHALAADMDAGEAVLWIARATLDHATQLTRWWLAGPILQILSHRAVTPVHAACVARGGRGLLLCGPPGAGKSVLAWAAASAGFTFISDDVSYLVRNDPTRILGRPNLLRLKPSAGALVPALAAFATVSDDEPDAQIYELDPARDLNLQTASECRLSDAILLERTPTGPADLKTIPSETLHALLDATLPQSTPAVTQEQIVNLRTITSASCWRLRYTSPAAAIASLP